MNAEQHTPIDRTDKLLQRMIKDGYLIRTRELDGGEEQIEFLVGPRGKIEVGMKGVAGLVREVYGQGNSNGNSNGNGGVEVDGEGGELSQVEQDEREIFEGRLRRSLGIRERPGHGDEEARTGTSGLGEEVDAGRRSSEGPRRSRRSVPAQQGEEESSGEEDSASDSD